MIHGRLPLVAFVLLGFGPLHFVPVIDRAFAQESTAEALITDRPDFTESTATVAPGRLQFEAGYTFTRQRGTRAHTSGEPLLRVGVLRDLEARISPGSYTWVEAPVRTDGLEDAEIGMKWTLTEASIGPMAPAVALLASTTLPTGDGELGEDGLQPRLALALAWTLSDRISVASNLSGAAALEEGDRFAEWAASLALGFGLTERVGTYVEVFGFAPDDRPDDGYVNGGLTYIVTPDVQLDARVGLGLDGPWPNYFTGAGFAWRR